jgi:hypothetical protein
VLRDRTAGDPMRQEVRWTDLTYEQIAGHLAEAGTPVSVPVVKQLLRKHGYVKRKAQRLSHKVVDERIIVYENAPIPQRPHR